MNKWKEVLWKTLFPKTWIVFLLFNLAAVFMLLGVRKDYREVKIYGK